jgi:hypothetical protein
MFDDFGVEILTVKVKLHAGVIMSCVNFRKFVIIGTTC